MGSEMMCSICNKPISSHDEDHIWFCNGIAEERAKWEARLEKLRGWIEMNEAMDDPHFNYNDGLASALDIMEGREP